MPEDAEGRTATSDHSRVEPLSTVIFACPGTPRPVVDWLALGAPQSCSAARAPAGAPSE